MAAPDRPPVTGTLRRPKRGLWRRIVDFALTDVNTLVDGGLDGAAIERLEEVLLEADFGVDTTLELVEALERAANRGAVATEDDLRDALRARLAETLAAAGPTSGASLAGPPPRGDGPGVLLLVGVNGVGKTTTAAKLAKRLQAGGGRVLLAAADTFRAGAQEQLRAWAERLQTDFVGGTPGADPASVAFDAVAAARARDAAWVLVDTAGRLHTQDDLMRELVKIDRVLGRQVEGAPYERLLVVDATSGTERDEPGATVRGVARPHGPRAREVRQHGARRHRGLRRARTLRSGPLPRSGGVAGRPRGVLARPVSRQDSRAGAVIA